MEEPLLIERQGATWLFVLNRPTRLNSVNAAMSRAMNQGLSEFQADREALVGIVTGSGDRAFSTGADLKEVAAGGLADIVEAEPGGFAGARHPRSKPLIAAVNGLALGGGFEIALACDLIVASAQAEFGLPEVSRGFLAGAGGLQRLPRLIGYARAMEVILAGARIDAQSAHGLGLINVVTDPDDLMDVAKQMAARIEAGAPLAIQESRKVARRAVEDSESAAWDCTDEAWEVVLSSDDYREGVAAFTEKRDPEWTGS